MTNGDNDFLMAWRGAEFLTCGFSLRGVFRAALLLDSPQATDFLLKTRVFAVGAVWTLRLEKSMADDDGAFRSRTRGSAVVMHDDN